MKKIIIVGVALAIIAYLGVTLPRPSSQTVIQKLGAVSGPSVDSPFFTTNGVTNWKFSFGMRLATTTPCNFKSPGATTTLNRLTVQITTATSSALSLDIATSTIPNATTTTFYSFSIASGVQGSWVYAPTTTPAQIFAPNTWIAVGAKGNSQPLGVGGFCRAEFTEL